MCYVLRATYYVLRNTYYVLCTTYYILRTMYHIPSTTYMYHTLCTTHYVLRTTYYVLRTTHYILLTTYQVLRTTYYVLKVEKRQHNQTPSPDIGPYCSRCKKITYSILISWIRSHTCFYWSHTYTHREHACRPSSLCRLRQRVMNFIGVVLIADTNGWLLYIFVSLHKLKNISDKLMATLEQSIVYMYCMYGMCITLLRLSQSGKRDEEEKNN